MSDPVAPPAEPSISHRLWAYMRSVPVTLAIVAVLLVAGAVKVPLWESAEGSGLVDTWGWGEQAFEEGRWWTIITGVLTAPTPWMYLLIIAIFVAGGVATSRALRRPHDASRDAWHAHRCGPHRRWGLLANAR